jgi:hypothetical protein
MKFIIGLSLLLCASRLAIIAMVGNITPFWDEWGNISYLITTFLDHQKFDISALFASHNEHRIFVSRLISLGVFFVSGDTWSQLLEMSISAGLYGFIAYLLFSAFKFEKNIIPLLICFVFLAIPFGTQNLLAGFQTAYFSTVIFTLILIYIISHLKLNIYIFIITCLLAACAFFSTAGGIISSFVAAIIVFGRALQLSRPSWMIYACLFVLISIIEFIFTPRVSDNNTFQPKNIEHFILVAQYLTAWPLPYSFFWVPLLIFVLWISIQKINFDQRSWFILGLFLWSGAEIILIAISRGQMAASPRYKDLLVPGIIAQFAMAFDLIRHSESRLGRWVPALCVVLVLAFSAIRANDVLIEIREKSERSMSEEYNTVYFLRHGRFDPDHKIPYPDENVLATLLADPAVVASLPPVRQDGSYGFEQGGQLTFIATLAILVSIFGLGLILWDLVPRWLARSRLKPSRSGG